MIEVIGLVAPLFTLIFLGYISAKLIRIPLEGLAWLNFFVIYVALPPLFFRLLSKTPVSEFGNIKFLLCASTATLFVFITGFTLAKTLKRGNTQEATIQGLSGAYGNIGYLGPPLAIAAFGPEAGVPVALIFCIDNTLHFTLTPLLMSVGNNKPGAWLSTIFKVIKNIITHPFILATIVGIIAAFHQYQPPEPAVRLIDSLANAAAPCALFALGVSAALRPLTRVPPELLYLLPLKLLLHPLLVYLAVSWIPGIPDFWVYSVVLLAALPTATNVFVIAQQYDTWEQRASSMVVISTLLSIFTVTTLLYLAKNGYL